MAEPFIAEIKIFAGNFAPRGYAFCNGQLLPIAQNTALFSLIGTTFGGDGRTTTALPNLQDRVPLHPGHGPGLTTRRLGEKGGVTTVTLAEAQMPSHTHQLQANSGSGPLSSPQGNALAQSAAGLPQYAASPDVDMVVGSMSTDGNSLPHNNEQPFLTLNFIIALVGLYPSRN